MTGLRLLRRTRLASLILLAATPSNAQLPPTQAGYVTVDRGAERIYFESTGSGDAVILSHGAGGNHAIWANQVVPLATKYRVVTWDQRGWGKSSNERGLAGSAETAVEDLRSLLDHLGIEKAHVVGQSMGGWVVAGFALRYPERTLSLTLANTYGGLSNPSMRKWTEPEARANRLRVRTAAGRPTSGVGIKDPERAFLYTQIQRLSPPRSPAPLGLSPTQWSLDKARSLTMPILIVSAPWDGPFGPEILEELHQALPGSRLEVIPDAGHSPYFERPEIWNRVVMDHLEGR